MNLKTSRLSGFHKLNQKERLTKLDEAFNSPIIDHTFWHNTGNIGFETADAMVENVIGTMNIPVGIATNLIIDSEEKLAVMATEESSVIAAVCNAAKQCRSQGGFHTSLSGNIMIAQVQLINITDPHHARILILEKQAEIASICNEADPVLVSLGGGFNNIEVRVLNNGHEQFLVVHLLIDTLDAMGANTVNTMAEKVAPYLAKWTGGQSLLRILSNLATHRLARSRATWHLNDIGGESVRDGILSAYQFAICDPYRAATHNKGIMNGMSAVVLATGNDTRAVEAGAHAYAVKNGQYSSLTHWEIDAAGNLCGSLEVPLAVGLVGGATKVHPAAKQALEIMQIKSAEQLSRLIAAVGLAQNFAALKALATTGIQKGHMALHAKNIAVMAGAQGDEISFIADKMIQQQAIRIDIAQSLLAEYRKIYQ